MGRFMIEGIVLSEPASTTLKTGGKLKTVTVEEHATGAKGTLTYTHEIEFFGYNADRIPSIPLTGCHVFITGTVSSKSFGGRNYHDLFGDSLLVISGPTYEDKGSGHAGSDEPDPDDLPF